MKQQALLVHTVPTNTEEAKCSISAEYLTFGLLRQGSQQVPAADSPVGQSCSAARERKRCQPSMLYHKELLPQTKAMSIHECRLAVVQETENAISLISICLH